MEDMTIAMIEIRAKRLLVDDVRKCQRGECTFDNLSELVMIAGVHHAMCAWAVLLTHFITIFMHSDALGVFSYDTTDIVSEDADQNYVMEFVTGCFNRLSFNDEHEANELVDWLVHEWLLSEAETSDELLADRQFSTFMHGLHLMKHMAADLSSGNDQMMLVLEGAGIMN